jgi:hypothetical protein
MEQQVQQGHVTAQQLVGNMGGVFNTDSDDHGIQQSIDDEQLEQEIALQKEQDARRQAELFEEILEEQGWL